MSRVPLTGDVGFARDLGSGITFPTQGPSASALRRGDAYYHTTYGALFLWNGTAWRSRGPGELTSAQRTALASGPYAGFQVFETDTARVYQWLPAGVVVNGTALAAGIWDQIAGQPEVYALTSFTASYKSVPAGAYQQLAILKRGRDCWFEGQITANGAITATAGANSQFGTLPAAVRPIGGSQEPAIFYTGTGATIAAAMCIVFNDLTVYVNTTVTSSGAWVYDLSGARWRTNA